MNLDRFQLHAQVSAGRDGVSYRGQDPNGPVVEVRDLTRARGDAGRWPTLVRRLRLAAMVQRPAVLVVREMVLEDPAPYVVLEWLEDRSLAEHQRTAGPIPPASALTMTRDLAEALRVAHLLGLSHGTLSPHAIRMTADGRAKIDFCGTETGMPLPADSLEASCRAPELQGSDAPSHADSAADVYALGSLLFWLLTGAPAPSDAVSRDKSAKGAPSPVPRSTSLLPRISATGHQSLDSAIERLVLECLAVEPTERPTAKEIDERLTSILNLDRQSAEQTHGLEGWQPVPSVPFTFKDGQMRERLGRFRLLEKLGQGGMGTVYRGEDPADGSVVAIKVLRPHLVEDIHARRRFEKEARLLAKVNNPHVANLLEVNKDDGLHYLVMEYVIGKNLGAVLEERGKLDEALAVAIMADVARALVDAHERGIVHRDVKPGNIVMSGEWRVESGEKNSASAASLLTPHSPLPTLVKLLDFGLARHMVESESLQVTQAGVPVGTPLYMSPEQGLGKGIDPRTDVYSMGATLFHMLTGRPPFDSVDPLLGPMSLILRHAKEPLPSLKKLNPDLSGGVCQIVEKALAKSPEARYADAGAMLQDLERLQRGEPTSITVHPRLPANDPRKVFAFDWVWDLAASPSQLWPYVSNTERLNRAAAIPAVTYSTQPLPGGGVRLFGQFRKAGFNNVWEEHPFEWVEGRRMGVLREYSEGVFLWLMTVTELEPLPDGGTRLTHRVRIEPRNLIGRLVASMEVGVRGRKAVERVYRRIDAAVTGQLGNPALVDPFEVPTPLAPQRRQRLDALLGELRKRGVPSAVAEKLGDFLAHAPPQEVARIRPLALAHHLGLDPDQFVVACLHGAQIGLLVLLWDLLCPVCRIPSEVKDTLKALQDHSHCEVCNLDFPLDFAKSVEMIFRANPEVRDSDLATYCLGGPDHSPHVTAQVRVGAGEQIELPLELPAGSYTLRGPQLPYTVDFRVHSGASGRRLDLALAREKSSTSPRSLKTGGQVISLSNDSDQELLVRVERTAARADALTAARASSLALFRELFPGEVLTPGQLISVATVTLLATDLAQADNLCKQLGETKAFGLIHEHFRLLEDGIRRAGGAVVKTVDERLLAAFEDPLAASQAALELPVALARNPTTRDLRLRVGVHRGSAMMATFNDHLDYFGSNVKIAWQLPRVAEDAGVVMTEAVASEPHVAAWLRQRGIQAELLSTSMFDGSVSRLHRLKTKGGS